MADSNSSSDLQSTRSLRESEAQWDDQVVQPTRPQSLPESIGRFRPLGELGRGGGGIVYLANDPVLNRRVAVKVPKATGSLSDFPFLTEARAAARLKHPHVVQIFDVGSLSDGGMFIAMELVSGGSLASRLKHRRPLNWKDAARVVAQIASAIDVAHQNKLLHRDLKPSNVLLDEHGNAKVADFGLSMSTDDALTSSGSITGTPAYMSPEQASGDSEHLTAKTDLWSIGVILYESLTGRRPFASDSWITLQQCILQDSPAPPRTIDRKIPRAVEQICLACLQKTPADRPDSAALVAEQLQNVLKRHQKAAARRILSAAALLMVVAVIGVTWKWGDRPPLQGAAAVATLGNASAGPDSQKNIQLPETPTLRSIDGRLDLMTVRPDVWSFDLGDPKSLLSIQPDNRHFSMSSPSAGIFAWPVLTPPGFRWKTRFVDSPEGTTVTLAWNVHPAVLDSGTSGYRSDSVSLTRRRGSAKLFTFVGQEEWTGRAPAQIRQGDSATAQLRDVDAALNAPIDVEIAVRDGLLQTFMVNGVIVRHEDRRFPAFDPPPASGQPALFVHGGQLSVVENQLTSLAEVP